MACDNNYANHKKKIHNIHVHTPLGLFAAVATLLFSTADLFPPPLAAAVAAASDVSLLLLVLCLSTCTSAEQLWSC